MIKNLLRFIVPIIIAFAFICGIERVESAVLEDCTTDLIIENTTYLSDYSSPDFELSFPLQSSSTNILRNQNTSKQTNTSHNYNLKYLRTGNIISESIQNFIQKKSLIYHSSFIKPINRLISFGKLVI